MNDFKLDIEPKIETGFKIPEGYFDDFSKKIVSNITKEEPKVISLFAQKKTWVIAVAAVFVIGFSIPIVNQFQTSSSELDKATLENYLVDQSSISDDDFAALLDESDIQKIKFDSKIEDKAIEDLLSTNSDLEEYIIN
jgi:hypothetical protein